MPSMSSIEHLLGPISEIPVGDDDQPYYTSPLFNSAVIEPKSNFTASARMAEIEHLLGSPNEIPQDNNDPQPNGYYTLDKHGNKIANTGDEYAKKQWSIAHCGKLIYTIDPMTRKKRFVYHRCGYEQDCPSCFRERVERLQDAPYRHLLHGEPLNAIIMKPEEATKALRGIGKEHYLKYPLQDGTDLIFVDSAVDIGQPVDETYLRGLEWEQIALRTKGRNISGKLGARAAAPVESDPDAVEVEFEEQSISSATKVREDGTIETANEDVFTEVHDEAVLATADLNPKTAEELTECLRIHIETVAQLLIDRGYQIVIHCRTRHVKLCLHKIDWSQGLEEARYNYNRKFGLKPVTQAAMA